jgi:hypothetical protein
MPATAATQQPAEVSQLRAPGYTSAQKHRMRHEIDAAAVSALAIRIGHFLIEALWDETELERSVAELASGVGSSTSGVRKALVQLEAAGLWGRTPGTGHTSTCFRWIGDLSRGTPRAPNAGHSGRPKRVTQGAPNGAPPLIRPSVPSDSLGSTIDDDAVEEAIESAVAAGCSRDGNRAKIRQVLEEVGLGRWCLACQALAAQKQAFSRLSMGLLLSAEVRERLLRENPNTRFLHINGYSEGGVSRLAAAYQEQAEKRIAARKASRA